MKIWAHRGCSLRYPENTLLAFEKAASINGLEGIELDVQMTKDGELAVIHDEKVDRTTDGKGFVKDYTLAELKKLHIKTINEELDLRIPTLSEVLDLLQDKMIKGLKLNIELKNSIVMYPGMEKKIIDLVNQYGVSEKVVYSSFYVKSLEIVRKLAPNAEIGMLDNKASDCIYKMNGNCGANAIHPYVKGMDIDDMDTLKEKIGKINVRAWLTGYLYPEKPSGKILDIKKLENSGITDVFLNEPEVYL